MAKNEIFIDTSALYAFVDRNDAGHKNARDAVAKLATAGRQFIVTDYVVAETVNLANARGGSLVANRVLDLMENSIYATAAASGSNPRFGCSQRSASCKEIPLRLA